MLELAILGLLKEEGALHGYEVRKRLCGTLGLLSGVSFGSLYPALSRLERSGAVRAVDDAAVAPAIPMTGGLTGERAAFRNRLPGTRRRSGRSKKAYAITPRGEEVFEQLLADGAATDDDRTFSVRLAFARHLSREARLQLLQRRRVQLVERLDGVRNAVRAGKDRLDGYASSVMEHRSEATEHDISWLDRLIAKEQEGTTA
jgi:DNA-binding PadR family transcriptional regulator